MTVQLNLAPDTVRILQERAARAGQTLEAFLEQIADREARLGGTAYSRTPEDPNELEHILDELSTGLPTLLSLPADFSRADIYGEHA